ncbi:MAG: penicillin-binding protein 1A [Hydrococcus sp. Prado102]|nr:penicillin-binding protein 1A [Hydrococcus sp. Prado102]
MVKKFNPIKKRLSQVLHSIAEKLEIDSNSRDEKSSVSTESPPAPQPPQPTKRRRRRRNSPRLSERIAYLPGKIKQLSKRTLSDRSPRFWLLLGASVSLGGGAIVLGLGVLQLESGMPDSVKDVLTYAPPETITIKASDGTVLREIGNVSHEKLKIWQISDSVKKAFIASEDRRFKEHRGVDFPGIARAIFANLQAGEVVEGGSTITQQLARIVFLNQGRNIGRKYREMRLAKEIENNFTKDQILERYLNLVYLGSGAYGVADAAWVYFSKPVSELTLAEAATLAGIVPAPSVYSPLENPQAAKQRRDTVLKTMQAQGVISAQEAEDAIASPLQVNPSKPKRLERQAPYFTAYIEKELPKLISKEALEAGGLTVETTLNSRWQKAAEEKLENAVERYGKWQRFSQAAMVAIDPRNGQIRAMVGGTDFSTNQFNRVTQAKRQPGSTFKTFVYATAIAAGISPYKSFMDAEYVVDGYKPENYGDSYSGAQVPLRTALAKSLNVIAVRLLVDVGWNPIIKLSQQMGIESKLQPTYSLALGASEVNLLELTSAYGTLANQGVHQKAYGISRIRDRSGNILYQAQFQPQEAIDPDTSSIMTWMLQGVVDGGTGVPAQIGRPAAGKTGTSDKARDLWFVGYIPQLVTGVWLGNDDNKETWGASSMAAVLWRQFMLEATENMPVETFSNIPNQIEARKATIKAEPIKPRRSYYNFSTVRANSSGSQIADGTGESIRPRRRRRRRNRQTVTYSQPERRSSRRVRSSSVRRATSQRVERSAPAPAAAPPPAQNFAPPAPPASRKEE